ncbi:DUF2190 family protein [Clostridium botulinum]|uniref:DUF2190 family protein n=1 Tax=Clostridium botulinum TaxID=1491 RepID=A0A0M1LJ03_CLOBO|nr:DUF2190 family protein [Clostridium botulinum]KAI3350784.1 DUF2190 family protein [Clostridium botulinum]KOM88782.1 hypothetical protein ACP51_05985 [Clostridium botulinum]KOR57619.1 hypothetical protein ADT22_12675 [Clostridium botulinum]NFE58182.1 DUF2190 family protein [Clostridium botulinum]NFE94519.1 DUF2190 family protein [Clostridium botulinum]
MKAIYCQRGESIDYKNKTDEIIKAGTVVSITSRVGVAGTDINANKIGSIHVVGVFELEKSSEEEISVGAKVYYDPSKDCITATEASNIPAGYATADAQLNNTSVYVKLLG